MARLHQELTTTRASLPDQVVSVTELLSAQFASRRADSRRLLVAGAASVHRNACRRVGLNDPWFRRMLAERLSKLVAAALASYVALIILALSVRRESSGGNPNVGHLRRLASCQTKRRVRTCTSTNTFLSSSWNDLTKRFGLDSTSSTRMHAKVTCCGHQDDVIVKFESFEAPQHFGASARARGVGTGHLDTP